MIKKSVAEQGRTAREKSSAKATKREVGGRRMESDSLFDVLKALPLEERVAAIDLMAERMGV